MTSPLPPWIYPPALGSWRRLLRPAGLREAAGLLLRARPRTLTQGRARGLRFACGHSNHEYSQGGNELPVQDALAARLRPGDTFYDVGANVGFFTVIGAQLVGSSGRVLAFEPLPENARLARYNARLNGLGHVNVLEKAVAAKSGRASFARARYSGGSMLASAGSPPDATGERLDVETVALDDVVRGQLGPPPSVIKIDVEGAELDVLLGMDELLRGPRPVVVFEVDAADTATLDARFDACRTLLEGRGYRVDPLPDSYPSTTWHVKHGLAIPTAAEESP